MSSVKTAQKVRSHRDRLARKVPKLKEENRSLRHQVAELQKMQRQQPVQASSRGMPDGSGWGGAGDEEGQDALKAIKTKLETATNAYKRQKGLSDKVEKDLQEAHMTIARLRAANSKLETEKQLLARTLASRQQTAPGHRALPRRTVDT